MSYYASENLGFFETVQVCFTELTRRSIFLSGRDLELLEQWRQQGATSAAVCKGLRDAVEAMPEEDPPRDVYACRHYVQPYVDKVCERSAGGHDRAGDIEEAGGGEDSQPEGLVEQALAKIEEAGRWVDDETLKEVYRRAWRQVRQLTDGEDEEYFERLAAIEEGLAEGYYRALDRRQQARIEQQIDEQSGELLGQMSPEARREHKRARMRRLMIENFEMISLFD